MAYDEDLADRIRAALGDRDDVVEKKMFGGLAFMIRGNMCVGVVEDELMARVGPENFERALALPHAREMDFTGRSMKGYVFVAPEGTRHDRTLREWVGRCVAFVESLPPK